jgi:putative transposase
MMRSYELRLKPTRKQKEAFARILLDSQETYNAALQERRDAWKLQHKSISLYDQCAELARLREDPQFSVIASDIQREPLRRIDRAFKAFFRRCKSGEDPGFPRFRSVDRYTSFAWHSPRIHGDAVLVPNLGHVRFKAHQEIKGTIKQATIKLVGKKWVGRVTCDIGPAPGKCVVSHPVGIDVGLTTFATLSDGSEIPNPRFIRQHVQRIARAQKNLARKKRGSKNRLRAKEQTRRAYQRMADARKNFCHHVSKALVARYDLIAHEDLKISNMVKGYLAKSILDAAWGQLLFHLAYKAERAGRYVVAVNPRGTTQRCSRCGETVPKGLADRWHECPHCGLSLNRDHNAAINILALGENALGRSVVGVSAEGPK